MGVLIIIILFIICFYFVYEIIKDNKRQEEKQKMIEEFNSARAKAKEQFDPLADIFVRTIIRDRQQIPESSIAKKLDYFFLGGHYIYSEAKCSDNSCPCTEVIIPKHEGYLYVEKNPNGYTANLTCEQGARLRNLDLQTAHKDAKHWWKTGEAPYRETPINKSSQEAPYISKLSEKDQIEKKKKELENMAVWLGVKTTKNNKREKNNTKELNSEVLEKNYPIVSQDLKVETEVDVELQWWKKNDTRYNRNMEYPKLLDTDLWRKRREEILNRDNHKCTKCRKKRNLILHVHHKLYVKTRMPWCYPDDELVTVCSECHIKIHNTQTIPFYLDEEAKSLNKPLTTCDRCNGYGYLPEYYYIENGICFKCMGKRYA